MSMWIAGAMVTTAVVGGVQAKKAGDKAAGAQERATAAGEASGEAQLDFAYEQYDEQLARYDEWRQIYGPIEENLGDFYNQLTPETFTAAGLEYNQAEVQKAKTQTFETLAQRGLDSSGILAATERKMNLGQAEERSRIRRDAPFEVAKMKGQFLSEGKGGPTQAPTGTVGSTLANVGASQTRLLQGEADRAGATSDTMWGAAGSMLSTGLQYGARNYQPTANTGQVIQPVSSSANIVKNPTP